ncbi:hypothetical protein QFZ64_001291 [Streptomyces sp. B3I8]|nr:hypothetical protein [Streptomyces sp. B3I8]
MLGALVVPTTIGSSSEGAGDTSPQPATSDRAPSAASRRRSRFRLDTCALLDPPIRGARDRGNIPQRNASGACFAQGI